jgi:hypothetical protein
MRTARITPTMNVTTGKFSFICLTIAIGLLVSCNKENAVPDLTSEDTENASVDTEQASYMDDADDVVTEGLAYNDDSGGKVAVDERLSCALLSHEGTGSSGKLRIDFGDGCTDPRGNVRRGAIVVEHDRRWNEAGGRWSISYDDYSINDVRIEGTRTVTIVSANDSLIVSDVILAAGKITFPDGRVITRDAKHRREHERHSNHLLDRLIIYGTATGAWHDGTGYSIEILERLIYRRACSAQGVIIPVKGKKLIKHGERELTVAYGEGDCDNVVVLTNKAGKSYRYEVGK